MESVGCIRKVFSDEIERGPLRRVAGQRNQSLLPPWIVVDLRIQSPSLPDAVDTRSEPQLVARRQQLASHERPKDASPIRARDRLGESPSSRGLTGRVETEPFVPLHRTDGRGDGVWQLHCGLPLNSPTTQPAGTSAVEHAPDDSTIHAHTVAPARSSPKKQVACSQRLFPIFKQSLRSRSTEVFACRNPQYFLQINRLLRQSHLAGSD